MIYKKIQSSLQNYPKTNFKFKFIKKLFIWLLVKLEDMIPEKSTYPKVH